MHFFNKPIKLKHYILKCEGGTYKFNGTNIKLEIIPSKLKKCSNWLEQHPVIVGSVIALIPIAIGIIYSLYNFLLNE